MKLAASYQRSNLLTTIFLFLLAGAAFYLLLNRVMIFQVDEDLEIEQHEIETYTKRFGSLPQNVMQVEDQVVTFEQASLPITAPIRRTVTLLDEVEHEKGDFRQLLFTVRAGTQWYRISVSKSLEGTKGLTHLIGLIALAIIALLLLASFLINRIILRRLWAPFYKTIERIKHFELGNNAGLTWPSISIDEFALLNKTLSQTTQKASEDYKILKEFTENASHELQTPLAIVRAKLDLLIQEETLSQKQSRIIQDAYIAVRRMTHLNKSLLVLAKIEGGQYEEKAGVAMKLLLEEKLVLFEAFIADKALVVDTSLAQVSLRISPALADMLLNNLLSNAIHHNSNGGSLSIKLSAQKLMICNTSPNRALVPENLFSRFYKTTSGATRTGLGLAIARQVCDNSGYKMLYDYMNEQHCFSVYWGEAG